MPNRWGTSWGTSWASSWDRAEVIEPTVVLIGGDDAPGAKRKRRKADHDLFQEIESTVHALLHPAPVEAPAISPVVPESARRAVDELVVLAQGQHDLLQRAAALRAELREYEAQRQALLEQDEEDALIWMF